MASPTGARRQMMRQIEARLPELTESQLRAMLRIASADADAAPAGSVAVLSDAQEAMRQAKADVLACMDELPGRHLEKQRQDEELERARGERAEALVEARYKEQLEALEERLAAADQRHAALRSAVLRIAATPEDLCRLQHLVQARNDGPLTERAPAQGGGGQPAKKTADPADSPPADPKGRPPRAGRGAAAGRLAAAGSSAPSASGAALCEQESTVGSQLARLGQAANPVFEPHITMMQQQQQQQQQQGAQPPPSGEQLSPRAGQLRDSVLAARAARPPGDAERVRRGWPQNSPWRKCFPPEVLAAAGGAPSARPAVADGSDDLSAVADGSDDLSVVQALSTAAEHHPAAAPHSPRAALADQVGPATPPPDSPSAPAAGEGIAERSKRQLTFEERPKGRAASSPHTSPSDQQCGFAAPETHAAVSRQQTLDEAAPDHFVSGQPPAASQHVSVTELRDSDEAALQDALLRRRSVELEEQLSRRATRLHCGEVSFEQQMSRLPSVRLQSGADGTPPAADARAQPGELGKASMGGIGPFEFQEEPGQGAGGALGPDFAAPAAAAPVHGAGHAAANLAPDAPMPAKPAAPPSDAPASARPTHSGGSM